MAVNSSKGFVSRYSLGESPLMERTASGTSSDGARQRGSAQVEVTHPKHFPHRIWAACDFESHTPDYGWFGPAETNNLPHYPGNTTALGVGERPYQNFRAIMTGIK